MDDRADNAGGKSPAGTSQEIADRFRALTEHGGDAILEVDQRRRIVFASQTFTGLFGYRLGEIADRDILDLIHDDDRPGIRRIQATSRIDQAVTDVLFRLEHRNGEWRWVEATGCPYVTSNGEIRVILITRDVTERVTAEQNTKSQLEAEQQIAELSRFFVSLRAEDFDSAIDKGLDSAAKLARADRIKFYLVDSEDGEPQFLHWNGDGIFPHDPERTREMVTAYAWIARQLLKGVVINVPKVAELPDDAGRVRENLLAQGVRSYLAIPIRYREKTTGFLAFFSETRIQTWTEQDIHRLRLLADMIGSALRRNRNDLAQTRRRQRLEALAENATDAICELSMDGSLLYASASFTELTGYSAGEIREIDPFTLIHPEDRADLSPGRAEKLASEDKSGTASFRMRHSDGSWRWLEANARPFRASSGENRIAVVMRDVTSHHKRQVELTNQLELERSLSNLSREFLDRSADEMDAGIDLALGTACNLAQADRCWLVARDESSGEILSYEWSAPGIPGRPPRSEFGEDGRHAWIYQKLARGEAVVVPRISDLPEEAREIRETMIENGVQSLLAVPIRSGDRLVGAMGFQAMRSEQEWAEHAVGVFQLIAGMFTSAIRRKTAEANLRGSEARFRALAENAVDPICETSEFGKILYASPSLGELLGYTAAEIADLNLFSLIHPEDFRDMREAYSESTASDETPSSYVYRARHKDGTWVYVEGTASVFQGSLRETRIVNIIRDVSERQRAQRALERQLDLETMIAALSRRFLSVAADEIDQTLQQSLSDLAALADADRSLLFSFDIKLGGMLDVFEWNAEDVPSQSRELFDLDTSDFKWATKRLFRGQVVHIPDVSNLPEEAAGERASLKERGVRSLLGIPLHSADTPIGFLEFETVRGTKSWSAERITLLRLVGEIFVTALQRKRTENTLRNSQMQLMQAQKMEAVGTLAGGIAHDFNNQLTVMLGNARYVLRQVEDDPDLKDALTDLNRAAEHCSQLTRSLLAFSRRGPASRRALDLRATVDEARELLRPLIPSSIDFRVTHGIEHTFVEADATQLQQVLVNLAVNARDAMPEGGSLDINTCRRAVSRGEAARLGLPRPGSYVEISVADTGCGMDEATVDRIFDPFFTTKPLGEGTGLGLATAYGIVRESEGAIETETAVDSGTTFRVYLPRSSDDAGADEQPATAVVPNRPGTVLIVEDEESVRRFMQRTLEQSGLETLVAENGVDALRAMGAHDGDIDAIVTDIDMPQMSGIALARKLATTRPEIPVLFVSGSARDLLDEPVAQEALGNFLQKPFGEEELVAELLELIAESRIRD